MSRRWTGLNEMRFVVATALALAASGAAATSASAAGSWTDAGFIDHPPGAYAQEVLAVDGSTHDLLTVSGTELLTYRNDVLLRTVPIGSRPVEALAVDSSDHTAYLADRAADTSTGAGVTIVSGTTVKRVALNPSLYATSVAVDPTTHTAYVLSRAPFSCDAPFGCPLPDPKDPATPRSELSVIRGGAVVATIPVQPWAFEVAVDPSTHTAYVTEPETDTVAVIRDMAVVRRIVVPDPLSIAVDTSTHELYIDTTRGRFTRNVIAVVDGTALRTFQLDMEGPTLDLAVDPTTHRALVSGRFQEFRVVSSTDVVQRLRLGEWGYAVAVDASLGEAYVYEAVIRVLTRSDRPAVARYGFIEGTASRPPSVYAVFSQPMDRASTAAAVAVEAGGGAPVAGSVGWYGDQVLFWTPTAGVNTELNTLTIGDTATDAQGRRIVAAPPYAFSFPEPPPPPPVKVLAQSPDPGSAQAPCVYPGTPFWAVFDQPMDTAPAAPAATLYQEDGDTSLPGRIGWLGTQILGFTPDAPLALGTTPFLQVASVVAPSRAQLFGFRITGGPVVTEPTIAVVGPKDGATGVARSGPPIYVVFAQAMDRAKVAGAFTLRRASDGADVPGTVSFIGSQLAGFTPSAPLAASTRYTVSVAPAAFDTRGCQLAGTTSWSFTTAAAGAAASGLTLGAAPEPVDTRLQAAVARTTVAR